MKTPFLYRKRLIPDECILLKDDLLLFRSKDTIITKWNTIRPKKTLHHGVSCYFLNLGIKVSKFYDHSGNFMNWYCDIISHTYDENTDTYIFTDLLADVIISPDGFVKVVDLDELAVALKNELLTSEMVQDVLMQLNHLLSLIYNGTFVNLQQYIEAWETPANS